MKIILASNNQGKIKEFSSYLDSFDIIPYKDIIGDIDIIENGDSFKQNAIIKAKTIKDHLIKKGLNYLVLSDDSGISIEALNGEPGIKSARYSGGSDKDNNKLVIKKLKKLNITKSNAFYTAALCLIDNKNRLWTTHGFMWGEVIDKEIGDRGFGYDPLFIPKGFDKTLGELDENIKAKISHRAKALNLIKLILRAINE